MASEDDEVGPVEAADILGMNRSSLRKTPRDVLPYREVGTGENREPNRRYLRADVEAHAASRARRAGGLVRRIVALERQGEQHAAEIAELRRQVNEMRGEGS